MKACEECGEEMSLVRGIVREFSVHFLRWELRLWQWGMEPWCQNCADANDAASRERIENDAYDAGVERGYYAAQAEGDGR